MPKNNYFFRKSERIVLKKDIQLLFSQKNFIHSPLISARYVFVDRKDSPIKILVVVSKKNFKRAVQRNRIKRKIREAYRVSSIELKNTLNSIEKCLLVSFHYNEQRVMSYTEILASIKTILDKLQKIVVS